MHEAEGQLREFLLDSGLLSRKELQSAQGRATERGEPLSRALIESGVLSEEEVRRAVSHALGVPYVSLTRETIDPSALSHIPEPLCRARGVVAFAASERGVEVALLDIADLDALDFLKERTRVLPRLTSRESMRQALLLYQKQLKDRFDGTAQALLAHAASQGASAVHLEPAEGGLRVRYRLGGGLHEAMMLSRERGESLLRELKNLKGTRLSVLQTASGERAVVHLVRDGEGRKGFTLQSLGFHGEALELLERALQKKSGLISVSGEGVSTVLYTFLDMLTHPSRALFSVESAVEYRLPHVSQVQLSEGLSASGALRAALRSDADVVALHDIEERSALELAAAAARRSLVLVAGKQPVEGADHFLHQRLVKRLCEQCSVAYALTRSEARSLEEYADFTRVLAALREEEVIERSVAWKDLSFRRAEGCGACDGGYRGLLGLQELRQGENAPLSLMEDGLFKAAQGQTSVDELLVLASEEGA